MYDGDNTKIITHMGKERTMQDLKDDHFKDVGVWGAYDVLIYTGVITAGVSFDIPHFD